jgi:hypothetical protein
VISRAKTPSELQNNSKIPHCQSLQDYQIKQPSILVVIVRSRPHSAVRARLFRLFGLSITVSLLCLTAAAAGSKIVHRWRTEEPFPPLHKILVIAVLENYLIRQELEDEMERLLAKSNVQGIKSHMVLPPRNELMEGELKQRILESDLDAVLVIRPLSSEQKTEEVVTAVSGAYYLPPAPYYNFWPYWHMTWGQSFSTASYFKEHTVVTAEFNLYNTKDEKLLWSGQTETLYGEDFKKLAKDYAKTIAKQLKKDKIITAD